MPISYKWATNNNVVVCLNHLWGGRWQQLAAGGSSWWQALFDENNIDGEQVNVGKYLGSPEELSPQT